MTPQEINHIAKMQRKKARRRHYIVFDQADRRQTAVKYAQAGEASRRLRQREARGQ